MTSIHPEEMLYKLVVLTLIEDVGRKPLISTNFSYQGSVCSPAQRAKNLGKAIYPTYIQCLWIKLLLQIHPLFLLIQRESSCLCDRHMMLKESHAPKVDNPSFLERSSCTFVSRLPEDRNIIKQTSTICSS